MLQIIYIDRSKIIVRQWNERLFGTKIVIVVRQHAERYEEVSDGSQFVRVAYTDRVVSLSGDPLH